jgi:hypothetical protein
MLQPQTSAQVDDEGEEGPAIDTEMLVAALRREANAAQSEYDRLKLDQQLALDYYEAKEFGNEVKGRSQVILPDVQETIDYMSVSVLRTFVSGDRVVEFEATDEESEQGAREATAAIGFNFMRQQDGYRVLHDWCVSGLLERYGVAKTVLVVEERVSHQKVEAQSEEQLHLMMALQGIDGEIEKQEDGPNGPQFTIKTERREKRFIDMPIPAYEFRFSPRARHEDEADYLAHVSLKTRSDLVDMGFDRDQAYNLPSKSAPLDYSTDRDGTGWNDPESTTALQHVELWEEYARIDLDNDGIAERVRVFRVENEILIDGETGKPSIETVEEQPFSVFCPFPRPHRLVGYSLADKVMDIQFFRSTIARQLMDGMYNANMPRPVVSDQGSNEQTIGDLLSPVPGSPIRVKTADAIVPYNTTFDVGKSLTVMEWMTGERESRTGITRLNQGLDADALNKTATGTALMQAQGQQQEEFIARNLAEAFSRLMAKKYRLMRREADPFKVKVDGQYVMVDPANWPEEMNVTIRVGLGSGRKDQRIQNRMSLAPIMAEGFQAKKVSDKNMFNMFDGLVRDMGLGQGDDYWIDPDSPEAQQAAQQQGEQPPPDPAMIKVLNDQQNATAKLQMDHERNMAEIQLKALDLQQTHQGNADAAQAKLIAEQYRTNTEAQLDTYRTNVQATVAMHANATKAAQMKKNRDGGKLDA